MQLSTTVIAAKAALLAAFQALPEVTGSDYETTWGMPRNAPNRWVFVGNVEWLKNEWATNRSKEEEYTVEVVFVSQLMAGNAEEAETEVTRIAAAAEKWLMANPTLNLAPDITSTTFAPKKLQSGAIGSDAYEAEFHCGVTVAARIRRQ